MTAHADSAAEAELPPLTDGPHRKRIGLISVVACLGGLLFGYDTGVANGAEGPMAKELGLSLLQLGVVISSLIFAAAIGALVGGNHLRRHRASQDDPDARGAVLRRRPAGRVLTGRTRARHILADRLRGPGGRPNRSRARGRWRLDGGPGLPRGAGALRDPRIDHRAQRVGHRRRSACLHSWCNAIIGTVWGHVDGIWRFMFAVCALPAVALFFGMLRMPESPRWLVEKGRHDEALAVLKTVRSEDRAIAESVRWSSSPRSEKAEHVIG